VTSKGRRETSERKEGLRNAREIEQIAYVLRRTDLNWRNAKTNCAHAGKRYRIGRDALETERAERGGTLLF